MLSLEREANWSSVARALPLLVGLPLRVAQAPWAVVKRAGLAPALSRSAPRQPLPESVGSGAALDEHKLEFEFAFQASV
jgi:hypothetical protein